MSTVIVFQQMLVILILMGTGYFVYKRKYCGQGSSKDLSYIITNICNPAMMIASALDESTTATKSDILLTAGIVVIVYAILIVLGILLPKLLGVKQSEQKFYNMMTVYGNVGFVGIPVVSAVIGQSAVIYVTVFILVFNILVYTHGIMVLSPNIDGKDQLWKKIVNIGTIASVCALLLFWFEISLPMFLADSFIYAGRCTTFLSMVVLGAALADIQVIEIFKVPKLYIFIFVRLVFIPIILALVLKPMISNEMIVQVCVILTAMPMANMPLMMARQYDMECDSLSKGILLSTILSTITITVVSLFL